MGRKIFKAARGTIHISTEEQRDENDQLTSQLQPQKPEYEENSSVTCWKKMGSWPQTIYPEKLPLQKKGEVPFKKQKREKIYLKQMRSIRIVEKKKRFL